MKNSRMKRVQCALLGCSALALFATGCSSSDSSPSGAAGGTGASAGTVQLLSWWTGPGEADALSALIGTYKDKNPGADVNLDGSVTAGNWPMTLGTGID